MATPFGSLAGAFSLGIQADETTQATKFFTTLATVSGMGVRFDKRQPRAEHPGSSGARSFEQATSTKRSGFDVPWKSTFLMRPKFLPAALIACGFSCSTAAHGTVAGVYVHTLTIEDDASLAWMTARHNVGGTGSGYTRVAKESRGSKFSFVADREQIECNLEGQGRKWMALSGSPTYTAEVDYEFSGASVGEITCELDAATLVDTVLGISLDVNNGLRTDKAKVPMFSTSGKPLTRTKFGATGTLRGVPALYDLLKLIYGGSTSATDATLAAQVGTLNFIFKSEDNIPTKAIPYEVEWDLPDVEFDLPETIDNNGEEDVNADVTFTMIASDAEPLTVTVTNDVSQYVS